LPRSSTNLRWMLRGLAVGIVAVCLIALTTRVLPNTWPISANLSQNRLSYPLTYWNALGLLTALGIVFCSHLTSSLREPPVGRMLAAAALPGLGATLLFTFSRGGIAAAIVGVIAYIVLGRSLGLISGLIAAGPATAAALLAAYHADLLATQNPTTAAAIAQGHDVAVAVGICMAGAGLLRLALLPLDARLARLRLRGRARFSFGVVAPIAAVAAIVLVLLLNVPGSIAHQYHRFTRGQAVDVTQTDYRSRLTDPGNNGRIDQWEAAIDGFDAAPLHGSGAGTYQLLWEKHRSRNSAISDAHSLYAEVLGELGLPGLALVLVALLTPLAVAATRVSGPERAAYAAFLAAGTMLVLHAGADWDWEMPAVFAWYFAAAGVVLAAPSGAGRARSPGRTARLVAGLACLVIAVNPALVVFSEGPLRRSTQAFKRGDCRVAIDAALDSTAGLSVRPEPYEVLGWCDAHLGQLGLAMRAMRSARARDPDNWQYSYGLAVAQALAGRDPRAMARLAVRQNPLSALAHDFELGVRRRDPAKWRAVAVTAPPPFE
jgi:O-antigen ligase